MKLEKQLRLYVILLIVAASILVVVTRAEADVRFPKPSNGDTNVDVRQSNDMNNQTAGDITMNAGDMVGGDTDLSFDSKAYALAAPNLGDVDIAACLGSTQWSLLVGGKQKLVLNHVCMAEFYLKSGRFDLAAQSLCNQPEILMEYDNEAVCEADHDFTPPPQPDHDVHSRSDEFDKAYAQQEQEIEYMQVEQATLVGRIETLTQQIEEAPAPVVIQQQTEYSDEQYEAVFMALKGSDEDE